MTSFRISFFALSLLSLICAHLSAQDNSSKAELTDLSAFFGEWKGELLILKTGDTLQKVPMTLKITHNHRQRNISWQTVFDGANQKVTKPYVVEAGDAPGSFLLDEGNSIKIPHYLNGSMFSGFYKVMGRYFMTENRLISENEMLFTITVIPEKPALISGNSTKEDEEIPRVEAHEISTLQVARLEKVLE